MRILIISKYAWDDKLASGNTLSNFFSNWPNADFYMLYCRDSMPDNKCCTKYYSISPINILKNIFTPLRIGKQFTFTGDGEDTTSARTEDTLKHASKRHKFVFELVHDMIYASKLWLNKKLKRFVAESNPDIVFCFGVPDAFTYQLVKYVKKHLDCPIVAYYVDDHYINKSGGLNLLHRVGRKRLKEIAMMADKRYAIAQMMCDEYSREMNLNFELLYKGCDVKDVKHQVNMPINIVYAGNLLYHRDRILASIANALYELSKENKVNSHLDIYSGTPINDEIADSLTVNDVSVLHPAIPYEEIKEVMRQSDIVLHVESFDPEQIQTVRLSFSTKITDCIQSGSMVLAVGPENIASIEFLQGIPGVTVITNLNDVKPTLLSLLRHPSTITDRALVTNNYAKTNMTIDNVRKRIQEDFVELINK